MPFRALLRALVTQVPRARGAIFCDYEGENVDLALAAPPPPGCASLSAYDLKIYGAQVAAAWMNLVEISGRGGTGALRELRLHCEQGTLVAHALRDGYYLLLLLAPGSHAGPAESALRRMAVLVQDEF